MKVLGFQKNPQKYFYRYHFVFVSRYLSILEAFASKKLVFAVYDNLVKEDYLKMSPFAKFMIIEKDPKRLAMKIQAFIANPNLGKKIEENAYQFAKKQTWEKMVELYLHLWKIRSN